MELLKQILLLLIGVLVFGSRLWATNKISTISVDAIGNVKDFRTCLSGTNPTSLFIFDKTEGCKQFSLFVKNLFNEKDKKEKDYWTYYNRSKLYNTVQAYKNNFDALLNANITNDNSGEPEPAYKTIIRLYNLYLSSTGNKDNTKEALNNLPGYKFFSSANSLQLFFTNPTKALNKLAGDELGFSKNLAWNVSLKSRAPLFALANEQITFYQNHQDILKKAGGYFNFAHALYLASSKNINDNIDAMVLLVSKANTPAGVAAYIEAYAAKVTIDYINILHNQLDNAYSNVCISQFPTGAIENEIDKAIKNKNDINESLTNYIKTNPICKGYIKNTVKLSLNNYAKSKKYNDYIKKVDNLNAMDANATLKTILSALADGSENYLTNIAKNLFSYRVDNDVYSSEDPIIEVGINYKNQYKNAKLSLEVTANGKTVTYSFPRKHYVTEIKYSDFKNDGINLTQGENEIKIEARYTFGDSLVAKTYNTKINVRNIKLYNRLFNIYKKLSNSSDDDLIDNITRWAMNKYAGNFAQKLVEYMNEHDNNINNLITGLATLGVISNNNDKYDNFKYDNFKFDTTDDNKTIYYGKDKQTVTSIPTNATKEQIKKALFEILEFYASRYYDYVDDIVTTNDIVTPNDTTAIPFNNNSKKTITYTKLEKAKKLYINIVNKKNVSGTPYSYLLQRLHIIPHAKIENFIAKNADYKPNRYIQGLYLIEFIDYMKKNKYFDSSLIEDINSEKTRKELKNETK
jgi:hypothetical protein